jgi:threonine synthase
MGGMPIVNATVVDFYCYGCGASTSAEAHGRDCPDCGEPFALRSRAEVVPDLFARPPQSLWTYFDLLPIQARSNIVTLNEGATPLLEAPRVARRFGLGRLLLKNEASNPTGSFKDRQVSVGISHARELGAETVAVVSSGNVACATAAYAARAGMRAVLLMHGFAAPGKIAQAAAYGANVVRVDSPSARSVFKLCIEACTAFGWYHLSTAGMYEPYNVEGAKTIAYELYQQTNGALPDWIVAPVGGGGLLGGIWRGFLDLQRLGLIKTLPRLAGVQAAGCAPLRDAIDRGASFLDTLKRPWPNPKTIAGGIADDVLFDGHTVLPAIRTTRGAAIAVTDDAIIEGELTLASTEGILCEPSSAVVIAALSHLPDAGPDTSVCCIVTGSGIKDLDVLRDRVPVPALIPPRLAALRDALGDPA